jgi:hypothetical protein
MRAACIALLLVLATSPDLARSDPSSPTTAAAAAWNEARWADWEAWARIAEGDYDGAVQAEKHANTARQRAAREQPGAHAPGGPGR